MFYVLLQTDLIALPPIVANRVLRRQPMNVHYLKQHLESNHKQQQQQSSSSSPPPHPHGHSDHPYRDQSRPRAEKQSTSEPT